jgi:NhaA family Na+:H+ antiporter
VPVDRDDVRALTLIRPLPDFLFTEAAGGVVLVVAIGAALVWANAWPVSYHDLWTSTFTIGFPDHHLSLTVRDWVNEGLMTVFFFVVGLEIKRELVEGELREPRKAALPAIAAVGGMVVPAIIYVGFNAGGAGRDGWGIPMATDIAIAVGVLSLLGTRVAPQLKLFLLALAIVDDIGAIVVIALFYSDGFDGQAALGALLVVLTMLGARVIGVRNILAFVVLGTGVWLLVHESGVHATLVGVVLGLLAPTRPFRHPDMVEAEKLADVSSVETAYETVVLARESVSVVEWLEYRLHPFSSYVIVPLFALANAGVLISGDSIERAASSPVAHGIVVGLVAGKIVGIGAFAWLACAVGIGSLPHGVRWSQMVGVAALGGIGFTVSLFVSGLAFRHAGESQSAAKLGILAASVVAAVLGATILAVTTRNRAHRSGPGSD